MKRASSSPRVKTIVGKTKLIRQEHYNANVNVNNDNLAGVPITRSQALDDIYHCFDLCMKGERVGRVDSDEEEEEEEGKANEAWENEFLYRNPYLDEGREIFRLVTAPTAADTDADDDTDDDGNVFSEGIREFREKTHVLFKETFFGMMWKILPKSANAFKKGYDGCFTKNYDGIIDKMNIVNQNEQFGTILDITIEHPKYILWTSFT